MVAPWVIVAIGTGILSLALRWTHRSIVILWFLMLPGIIAHEAMHWIVALLTWGFPGAITVIPKKLGRGRWRLGAVPIHNPQWYNAGLIGMAPFLLLPIAGLLVTHLAPSHPFADWPQSLLLCYICAVLVGSGFPSGPDYRLAMISWLPVLGLMAAVAAWAFS
ncbi:hypothetical protein JKG47_12960 [Acidithiobacillus sp. MC6.1]|nr:hypothetical protein [Acidithiobacillus sp. MC6.1]